MEPAGVLRVRAPGANFISRVRVEALGGIPGFVPRVEDMLA